MDITMGNQQLYRIYVSCQCNKKLYIGYTKQLESSNYFGSYTDTDFFPTHSFTISRHSNRNVALLQEYGYISCWDAPNNNRFANKSYYTPGSGLEWTDSMREKKSKSSLGHIISQDTKLKISNTVKTRWEDMSKDDYDERCSNIRLKIQKEQISMKVKENWNDMTKEDYAKRCLNISKGMKNWWNNLSDNEKKEYNLKRQISIAKGKNEFDKVQRLERELVLLKQEGNAENNINC